MTTILVLIFAISTFFSTGLSLSSLFGGLDYGETLALRWCTVVSVVSGVLLLIHSFA
jgi:hypothetical protein